MSTAMAIASTTQVLTGILDEAIAAFSAGSALVGNAGSSALPPDLIPTGELEKAHLNLFLYKVGFNPGWRDFGLPSRDSDGNPASRPPLALDLHYLLSAYASTDFLPEALLGIGMQALHECPVITRAEIRQFYKPTGLPNDPTLLDPTRTLLTAGLADQPELIKISPQEMSTEEISRLWTAFQAKYRVSASYLATVVLIESTGPVKSTLPVRQHAVYVLPFEQPLIESVSPQALPLSAGATIQVSGQSLNRAGNLVRFGNGEQVTPAAQSSGEPLAVNLPATLRAGVNTVQIVRQLVMTGPPARDVVESNVGAFLVQPSIANIAVDPLHAGQDPRSTNITLTLVPPVAQAQRVTLLLDRLNPPVNQLAAAYTFNAAALAVLSSSTVAIPVNAAAGDYLLRVRVDGADSALTLSTSGSYIGPKVTL